jgi:hypothetical protein
MADWPLSSRLSYVLWRGGYDGTKARLRAFWHHVCRGYPRETCGACGRPVAVAWLAENSLWVDVYGSPGGIRCIPCFDGELERRGDFVRWVPEVGICAAWSATDRTASESAR